MKSDREFLDGIYEKAAKYQDMPKEETTEKIAFRKRIFPAITTGLTACALFAVVLIGKNIGIFNKNDMAEEDLASRTRGASEMTEEQAEPYGVSTAEYTAEAGLWVSGVVENVTSTDEQITISFLVNTDYSGMLSAGEVVTIETSRSSLLEESDALNVGAQDIFCIERVVDADDYKLFDTEENVYLYAGEEEGEAVYVSLLGSRHRVQEFINQ